MKAKFLVILAALALLSGCIAEEKYSEIKKENIVDKQTYDLDGDGVWDYAVYNFSTVKAGDRTELHRMVGIARIQHATYSSFNNITDLDLLTADGKLNDFSREKKQDEEFCSRKIGLIGVKCPNVDSCARLCTANSEKCRIIGEDYSEVLGGSMLSYVTTTGTIDQTVINSRNLALELRNAPEERKNLFLSDLMEIKTEIAAMNTNPLLFHPELGLCEHSDYGVGGIDEAAAIIGNYQQETTGYEYAVVLEVKTAGEDGLSREVLGSEVEDSIPATAAVADVSSYQKIVTEKDGDVKIRWTASGMTEKGYMLYYYFQSETDPDALLASLNVPSAKTRYLDLSAVAPVNNLFLALYGTTGNPYFAAGVASGLAIALVLLLYSLVVFSIRIVEFKIAGKRFGDAVRKAFGRVGIRWKIDLPVGVAALAAGFFVSSYLIPEPFAVASILDMAEALMDPLGFTGFAFTTIGIVLLYDGVENLGKIFMIERYYGVAVREERMDYLGRIRQLREKLKELKELVEKYGNEDFDVSAEYAVATSLSAKRLDLFEKKMTSANADALEESLGRVESALEGLKERKATADENWQKWKGSIDQLLIEKNEVTSASLMAIPASLRTWALTKYAKEAGGEEIIFEKDVLKKKKTTVGMLLKEMVRGGLFKGGIIVKNENVVASYLEGDKSPTVHVSLLFKLRAYLHSLGKALALGTPASFVSVGDKSVFVLVKTMEYECGLLVPRDAFKDAMEKWKAKIKTVAE